MKVVISRDGGHELGGADHPMPGLDEQNGPYIRETKLSFGK